MLENLFDTYSRRARLYPALIALLPAFCFSVVHLNVLELDWSHAAWAAFLAAVLYYLADFSRSVGKKVEKKLLSQWSYFPSATLLRHRDQTLNATQTVRYHQLASSIFGDLKLPTADEELLTPEHADEIYSTISTALLPRTRNQKCFPILFKENINYGFRRNLLGLKTIGLFIIFLAVTTELIRSWPHLIQCQSPPTENIAVMAGSILMSVLWIFAITEDSVKAAAVDYAKQLLQSLETLTPD